MMPASPFSSELAVLIQYFLSLLLPELFDLKGSDSEEESSLTTTTYGTFKICMNGFFSSSSDVRSIDRLSSRYPSF